MRKSSLFALLMMGASVLLVLPAITTGQFQMGGKGSKGGGGFSDPGALFDRLAGTRGYIVISDMRTLRDPLTQFAQERGITNGQITKQQFTDFQDFLKNRLTKGAPGGNQPPGATPSAPGGQPMQPGGFGGRGPGGFGGNTPGGFGGKGPDGGGFGSKKGGFGGLAPGTALNPEVVNDFADREFKRADNNGDLKLHKDEMSSSLLASLSRWDKNGDQFIDQNEFRDYYMARMQGDDGNPNRGIATIIIEEDELERKAVVFRAGNLPKNIPSWFKDLDTDTDGQVALHEWRAGKKSLDEFSNWDLNDDGFIIPEEALRTQEILAKNTTASRGGAEGTSMSNGGGFGGFGKKGGENPFGGGFGGFGKKGGESPFGGGGFGGGGFGGFGKKASDGSESPFGGFGKKGSKKGQRQ